MPTPQAPSSRLLPALVALLGLALPGATLACDACHGEAKTRAASPAPENVTTDKFERDRQAILSMAGEYHINFEFMETVPLRSGYELKNPYHAEATEMIKVVEDEGDRIVLQHILVLEDEQTGEPRVVKHWRQDWMYEDRELLEYQGHKTWKTRTLSAGEVEGTWSQAVFQVDDSPRYESFGRWKHEHNVSSWTGRETWRPLPRREYTKRSDYHALVAVNRHTLTPDGWVHEQDNHKLVLDESGEPVDDAPVLCREVGLNTYTRIDDHDFSPGVAYWRDTAPFWDAVRDAWSARFEARDVIRLAAKVDDKRLYQHMFDHAQAVRERGGFEPDADRAKLAKTIDAFLLEVEETSGRASSAY